MASAVEHPQTCRTTIDTLVFEILTAGRNNLFPELISITRSTLALILSLSCICDRLRLANNAVTGESEKLAPTVFIR